MSVFVSAAAHLIERLITDHRRIEEAAALVRAHCARGDCVMALVALGGLHLAMDRHDGIEENALFPLVGRKLPDLEERLTHVRRQHQAMLGPRDAIERALVAEDAVAALVRAEELGALLVGNHTTEELVIYGIVEDLLAHLGAPAVASRP